MKGISISVSLLASVAVPSANAWAQLGSVPSLQSLIIVDADGREIGRPVELLAHQQRDGAVVLFEFRGQAFELRVAGDTFSTAVFEDVVLFESADCTGTPYLVENFGEVKPLWLAAVVNAPGQTVYLPDLAQPARTVTIGSMYSTGDANARGRCLATSLALQLQPGLRAIDLDTVFRPPYHVTSGCPATCKGTPGPVVHRAIEGVKQLSQ